MIRYLTEIHDCRCFWLSLVVHDIQKRYRRSILGMGWVILQPVLLALVICTMLRRALQGGSPDYYLYVLTGLCFWNYLAHVTSGGCQSIRSAQYYILQHRVPIAVYPLRSALVGGFHLLVALIPVAILSLRNGIPQMDAVLFVPMLLVVLLVFGWAMSTIFGIASLYFPDVQHLCQVGLMILFYSTPIIWEPEMLEGRNLTWVIDYNPLAAFVGALREPLIGGGLPSTRALWLALSTTVVSAILAGFLLAKSERRIIFRF